MRLYITLLFPWQNQLFYRSLTIKNLIWPPQATIKNFPKYSVLPDNRFEAKRNKGKALKIYPSSSLRLPVLQSPHKAQGPSQEAYPKKTTLPFKLSRSWNWSLKMSTRDKSKRAPKILKMSISKNLLSRINRSWSIRNKRMRRPTIKETCRIVNRKNRWNGRAKV